MLKVLAILVGLLFLILGVLSFIPELTPDEKLFGLFTLNTTHKILLLVSGTISLMCGLRSALASKIFFIVFGILYLLLTILGFYIGEGLLLNFIAINPIDNWLHLLISVVLLYFGFFLKNDIY